MQRALPGQTTLPVDAPIDLLLKTPATLWATLTLIVGALLYYLPGNDFAGHTYVPGNTGVALVGLAILALGCLWRRDLAVGLLPLTLPLFMLPRHLGHLSFSLSETMVILCTISQLVHIGYEWAAGTATDRPWSGQALRRLLVPPSSFNVPLAAFVVAATLATLEAHFRTFALREWREMIIEPALYYWLVIGIFWRSPQRFDRRQNASDQKLTSNIWVGSDNQLITGRPFLTLCLTSVIGAGLLLSAMGLIQYFFRRSTLSTAIYSDPNLHMATAVYGSNNNLGLLLDRTIPMLLAVLLYGVLTVRWRAFGWIGLGAMVAVLYLTHSRGSWLVTGALCVAVVAVSLPRYRKLIAGLAGLAIAGIGGVSLLAALHPTGRLSQLVAQGHGISGLARVYVWQSALAMIRDHPLWGVGPDNFLYYYSSYQFKQDPNTLKIPPNWHFYMLPAGWHEPYLSHPHNFILDFWLSTGLLGLLAALWLLIFFAWRSISLWRQSGDHMVRLLVLLAGVSVAALVLHGSVDNSYFVIDLATIFCLALAVIGVLDRKPT